MQKQKNKATSVGASARGTMSSSISLEVDQQFIVIEDVNPLSEMRMVVIPSGEQSEIIEQPAIVPTSLPLVTLNQEGTIGERAQPIPERAELEWTIALVIETEAVMVSKPEIVPPTTLMHNPIIASQDIPTTLTTAHTLLLLTSGSQFDKTATSARSEPAQSSASQSHHIAKLPSRAPSQADAFPEPSEIQLDLILANQHTFMANQCNLKRIMDKIEQLMLQILKTLQKGKGNQ